MPNLEIHLVRGNHDLQPGDPWPELRIHCHPDPWTEFDFDLRHLPVEGEQRPFLAGTYTGFSLRKKTAPASLTLLSRRENRIIPPPSEVLPNTQDQARRG